MDRAVAGELLLALQPLAMEAAVEAEHKLAQEQDDARRLRELELQQARYEARPAERRYAACDPDNRLVATQLEARWEECMRRIAAIEQQLLPQTERTKHGHGEPALQDLAADLEAAWNAPGATMRTRQRLVRALVEEIIADVDEAASEVVLTIHWKGGQHSQVRARKPRTGEHRNRASEEVVEVVRSMAGRWPDDQIAATLNRMGQRTGQGNTWNEKRVQALRKTHGIRAYKSAEKDGEWITMTEAAHELGVSNGVIRRLIHSGILPAAQVVPRAPYQILSADLKREEVIRAIRLRSQGPCSPDADSETLMIPGI